MAALVLSACSATTPERRPTRTSVVRDLVIPAAEERGSVLGLGDSIMVGARDFGDLELLLIGDGWSPEIVAEEAKTVGWAQEVVRARETVPPTIVVVLGSNPGPELDRFPAEVDGLIADLTARGATRIIWIPPVHREPERYAERLAYLEGLADDVLEVADWPPLVAENDHWLSSDGLHMSGDGTIALANFIADVLLISRVPQR